MDRPRDTMRYISILFEIYRILLNNSNSIVLDPRGQLIPLTFRERGP